jgi:hypothetical protein
VAGLEAMRSAPRHAAYRLEGARRQALEGRPEGVSDSQAQERAAVTFELFHAISQRQRPDDEHHSRAYHRSRFASCCRAYLAPSICSVRAWV